MRRGRFWVRREFRLTMMISIREATPPVTIPTANAKGIHLPKKLEIAKISNL